jgi:cell division protein FtsB
MANHRRNQSGAVRFVPACKAVLLCGLIGGSCVGYVIQKNRIFELAQQIGARQLKLDKLRRDNQVLAERLASLQLPLRLAQRAEQLHLGLVQPQASQILWITEVPPSSSVSNLPSVQYVQTSFKPANSKP